MEVLKNLSILCVIIGPAFQLIFGWLSNNNVIKLNLNKITYISIFSHFILTIIGVRLITYTLEKQNPEKLVCGMPAVGLIVISGFLFITMIVIILIQYYLKPKQL